MKGISQLTFKFLKSGMSNNADLEIPSCIRREEFWGYQSLSGPCMFFNLHGVNIDIYSCVKITPCQREGIQKPEGE
jgi:hypothetical protein